MLYSPNLGITQMSIAWKMEQTMMLNSYKGILSSNEDRIMDKCNNTLQKNKLCLYLLGCYIIQINNN